MKLILFLSFSLCLSISFGQNHWYEIPNSDIYLQSVTSHGYGWSIKHTSDNNTPPTVTANLFSIKYDFTTKKSVFFVSAESPLSLNLLASGNPFTALFMSKGPTNQLWFVNKKSSPITKTLIMMDSYSHGAFAYSEDLYYLRKYNAFYKVENDSLIKISSIQGDYNYEAKQTISFTDPARGYILLIDSLGEFIGTTKDSGKSWSYDRLDHAQPWEFIETRMIDFIDPANGVIISDSNKIYLTSDSGNTWTIDTIETEFQSRYNFIANNGLSYYLTGDSIDEIYKSDDKGKSWQPAPVNGFDIEKIRDLSCPKWDRCYVIDERGNLFMNQEITGIADSKSNFNPINLYPNPCHNELSITGIDANSPAQIELLNSKGELVDRFVNQGVLNTSVLSKGLYFLRINSVEVNEVIKFVKN